MVLNSTTATFCMILLLILGFGPVYVNDMLIEKSLHCSSKQSQITIGLDCFRDSDVCIVFLQTVTLISLTWLTIKEQCLRLLSMKDIEAGVLVNRGNI
jgi:hypothetical protein